MDLASIIARTPHPTAWEEGDNIPWNDPPFSERMLAEHLRQDTQAASRPFETIDAHVRWIHESVLAEQPTRILDLTCGPGLYTSRLARVGHECHGIDFAPAAIAHARDIAHRDGIACSYELADVRTVPLDEGFGLVMMIFGQFNVFRPSEAQDILQRAYAALAPGGKLLLEPQRLATVIGDGNSHTSWYAADHGLFSSQPHICLMESFWDEQARASTQRFIIIDAATAEVTRCALSNAAYTDNEYESLILAAGFENPQLLPSLTGSDDDSQSFNLAIIGQKPEV